MKCSIYSISLRGVSSYVAPIFIALSNCDKAFVMANL